jgi:tryptophan synthase alpha chain
MRVAARISSHNDTPLVFMGYYNPILAYGLQRFCEDARQNGICGLIIPDLPPDEAEPLREATMREGIALIFMIPPTIRNNRIARIADLASQGPGGFIYCVSRSGVTGSRSDLPPDLESFIARIRGYTEEKHIPLVVGFGLSTPEHIRQVTQYAEGAAVGSALVKLIGQHSPEEQPMTVKNYIRSLRGL